MNGKTCVITGGTSGIGEAAAIALAEQGADLALICRSPTRGEATKRTIEERSGRNCVQLFFADMERLADMRRVAAEINATLPKIDVLLNNAGVTMLNRSETPDGFETTFAVNHLAPFLLTRHDALVKESVQSRRERLGRLRVVAFGPAFRDVLAVAAIQLRVRHRGLHARLEVGADELERAGALRAELAAELGAAGFESLELAVYVPPAERPGQGPPSAQEDRQQPLG